MLCNSSASPKARRRRDLVATLDGMTAVARERITLEDCVTQADFVLAGYTRGEIAEHGETAIAAARRLVRGAAH